ncbi:MAG: hypothetical protein CBC65_003245 [Rhodothermaceae bacterium TMED105]|nr:MAG: hypothetical protein CBC65_003245 [Rhodothermaceae bacterium TMED105]
MIPSKLYDYMQFRKPIIGFDLEHEARTILTGSGLGVTYPESSIESIIDFIEGPRIDINESLIETLSVENQMKSMSDLLHSLCE